MCAPVAVVMKNALCLGPFNSWDRQVYVTDVSGSPSTVKLYDTLSYNFLVGDYSALAAIDSDDGSCYNKVFNNVLSYALWGQKSYLFGHDLIHHNNLYAYLSVGVDLYNSFLPGHENQFYNNTGV